jgi:predicted MPP superfamily phosphohydrolase
MRRRVFLQRAAAGLAAGALGGYGWIRRLEPAWVALTEKTLAPIPGLPAGLRILHLSDFHASDVVPLSHIESAIRLGLSAKPDLICLTGDYITVRDIPEPERYAKILKRLADAAPTYACPGNHDGGWGNPATHYPDASEVGALLRSAGIHWLSNERRTERLRGAEIEIVGLGDLWADDCRPEKVLVKASSRSRPPILLLSHNPDSKERLHDFDWDLVLCGHTHGGQLVVPLLGMRPYLPVRDIRYVEGRYDWEGRQLHITRGIGNLHGLRFNCRPEASLLVAG